jgi:hypothetical protein
MTAKVDGNTFTATKVTGNLMSGNVSVIGQNGPTGSGDTISIAYKVVGDGTGDYTLAHFTDNEITFGIDGKGTYAQSGTVHISKYSEGHVEGTFEFVGYPNAINVTEGEFSADW